MLAKKLRIKEGMEIVAINAPKNYKETLGALPKGVTIKNKLGAAHDFIQLFVKNKAELNKEISKIGKTLKPGGLVWLTYPKGSSGMQTDLTRDQGWEILDAFKMERVTLISFDEGWSAFLMRNNPAKEQSKASKTYHEIQNVYSDPKTKTVIIPEDVEKAFLKNKKTKIFFETLNYTSKKEYIMWIVSAKREETRTERIAKMMEKLSAGKKLPTEK